MSLHASSEALAAALAVVEKCSHAGQRYVFELGALLAGLKKVVRIQVQDDAEYLLLVNFASSAGLGIAHSSMRSKVAWTNSLGDTFLISVPWDDPEGTSYAAYLAKSQRIADDAAVIESEGTAEEIGQLLDIPECCCASYRRLEDREYWVPVLLEQSDDVQHAPWANRYAYLLYGASLFPDYFPCCLDCEGTHRMAKQIYEMAQRTDLKSLAQQYLELMCRPVIVGPGFLIGLPRDGYLTQAPHGSIQHEWIIGSTRVMPSSEVATQTVADRMPSLSLMDGAAARIIYFDNY